MRVQAVKGKQVRRIAVGIGDVIATSLIIGSRDGRTVMDHPI